MLSLNISPPSAAITRNDCQAQVQVHKQGGSDGEGQNKQDANEDAIAICRKKANV
jgi:hypothetical protein